MLIRRQDFQSIIAQLSKTGCYSVDTETTGLHVYQGHRLFSVIISDGVDSYYFNFQPYPNLADEWVLPREWIAALQPIFDDPATTIFMHNAKFDMGMLANDGITRFPCRIHCTEINARNIYNAYFSYELSECVQRIGLTKSSAVDEYIAVNSLFTVSFDHNGDKIKTPHYDKVPLSIMQPYGEHDARITHALGMWQLAKLAEIDNTTASHYPRIMDLHANDCSLLKACFAMEQTGIKVNRTYCKEAMDYELGIATAAANRFTELAGMEFKDSRTLLAKAFTAAGEEYPKTKKGNPSFTDEVLEGFTSPLAQLVRDYRGASKKANTYYRNFLTYADENDRIHANIRIAGTLTGRFSYSEPNLQNLSKNEEDDGSEQAQERYQVRRAFVPTNSDYCLVMIDYDQMEYRLMLDYSGCIKLIDKVLAGLDVHEATGQMMGVTRNRAKSLNFMLLYGGGKDKLARMLGLTVPQAHALKMQYFSTLPEVKQFSRQIIQAAEQRKVVVNLAGYRCHYPDPNFCYPAPNHLIQGGCAQVVRRAIPRCHNLLNGMKSHLLVQIHDELLFEIHRSEFDVIPELQNIMQSAYVPRRLPLTCSVSHSWVSWADKVKGLPDAKGNCIQKACAA